MKTEYCNPYAGSRTGRLLFQSAICVVLFILCFHTNAFSIGQPQYIVTAPAPGSFPIVQGGRATVIWVDSGDSPGVIRAVGDLKTDIARVAGSSPSVAGLLHVLRRPEGIANFHLTVMSRLEIGSWKFIIGNCFISRIHPHQIPAQEV